MPPKTIPFNLVAMLNCCSNCSAAPTAAPSVSADVPTDFTDAPTDFTDAPTDLTDVTLELFTQPLTIACNCKEAIKSFHPFINGLTKEFKDHWGGFAPPVPKEKAVEMIALKMPHAFFGHIQSWWQYRNEPNVFLLHYANLKTNPRHEISRIAEFLNITVHEDVMSMF